MGRRSVAGGWHALTKEGRGRTTCDDPCALATPIPLVWACHPTIVRILARRERFRHVRAASAILSMGRSSCGLRIAVFCSRSHSGLRMGEPSEIAAARLKRRCRHPWKSELGHYRQHCRHVVLRARPSSEAGCLRNNPRRDVRSDHVHGHSECGERRIRMVLMLKLPSRISVIA